jgi:hypothetical protein
MKLTGGKKEKRKALPECHLTTANPRWTAVELNMYLHSKRPVPNVST